MNVNSKWTVTAFIPGDDHGRLRGDVRLQDYSNRAKQLLNKLTLSNIYERIRYDRAMVLTYKCIEKTPANLNNDIQIERITGENINDALIYEPQVKVDAFKHFLNQGDIGFYAYLNGQFIHRSWVTFGPKTEPQWKRYAPIMLNKGEAFIHWCETVPWARGVGVYPSVLGHIVNQLSEYATVFYISTTEDNIASRRGIEKAGFSLISAWKVKSFLGFKSERALEREIHSE